MNLTVSVLTLYPVRHDHGTQVSCRGENPLLDDATLEDIVTLEVACKLNFHIIQYNNDHMKACKE